MSGKQIAYYRQKGRAVYGIDSERLIDKSLQAEEVFAFVLAHDNVLVYTSAAEEMQKRKADTQAFFQASKLMEKLMADLGEMAAEHGFTRIVVAGGETSGAVALRLGYHAYQIGNSIAPGVPILNPLERPELRLILKSGNFGGEDFLKKHCWRNKNYGGKITGGVMVCTSVICAQACQRLHWKYQFSS